MSVNKYNSEGYHDPTAYEALLEVEREAKKQPYRPLVFICSPLAGDVERNLQNARRYSKFAVERGAIPFAPHLLFPQFMDDGDKAQRDLGLFFGFVLMGKCDEVWLFDGFVSKGMRLELAKARKRGMKVRFFNEKCEEVQSFA
jgi:hypothetical protein